MIDSSEARSWARAFAVDVVQVGVTTSSCMSSTCSLGSTARPTLCSSAERPCAERTWTGFESSEDIDLLVDDVNASATSIGRQLPRMLRRSSPDVAVTEPVPVPRGRQMRIAAPDLRGVELQFIARRSDDDVLAFHPMQVALRYRRLPAPVELHVSSRRASSQ